VAQAEVVETSEAEAALAEVAAAVEAEADIAAEAHERSRSYQLRAAWTTSWSRLFFTRIQSIHLALPFVGV